MEVSYPLSQGTLLSVQWTKKVVMEEGMEVIHWAETDLATAMTDLANTQLANSRD